MAEFDVGSIKGTVDAVLNEDLYWFPVRHHSPAVSQHLLNAIKDVQPKIIFIEGPSESTDLIPYLVDAKTKPPIAIYSSYCDDDNTLGLAGVASAAADIPARFSSWYPMLEYSPELVAIRAAKQAGIETVFVDLPHYALIPSQQQPSTEEDQGEQVEADDSLADAFVSNVDQLFAESGFYQSLADEAGYKSWDEAWDTIFENGDWPNHEAFRTELATFCAAVRTTTVPERIAVDGTLERERFMMQTIRASLKKRKLKPKDAMVVCGGFHLFLDREDDELPPPIPAGTVYTTVIPYSFFRVSELSGYAAGNRAPAFYQRTWELGTRHEQDSVLAEHITAVLRRARQRGEHLSSADAIAVTQHARMLAGLRGRTSPVLDDIQDALITCCCKGNPDDEGGQLQIAIDDTNIGSQIGRVTPALGRLPIVDDFYRQLDELDFADVMGREKRLSVTLDKREETDRRRSVFLHRLAFLKIPIVELADAATSEFETGTIFREKWLLRWGPKVEPSIVEQNLFGTTIESAVLGRLYEQLAQSQGNAGQICGSLRRSLEMDLPSLLLEIEQACGDSIDSDTRFVSLCQALNHLTVITQFAKYRQLGCDLNDLTDRCFDRACFAMPDVASAPEKHQDDVVDALLSLADVTMKGDAQRFDRTLFGEQVRSSAEESTAPFLRGAFLGMLAEIRHLTTTELAQQVSAFARAPVDVMVTAGDFLDGVLAVSRTSIMLGAKELVGAMDELLRNANWEVFLTMIPKIRGAFERIHDRHRDSLAAVVAARYGLGDEGESITDLSTSVESAALIVQIDKQVAEIMAPWQFD